MLVAHLNGSIGQPVGLVKTDHVDLFGGAQHTSEWAHAAALCARVPRDLRSDRWVQPEFQRVVSHLDGAA